MALGSLCGRVPLKKEPTMPDPGKFDELQPQRRTSLSAELTNLGAWTAREWEKSRVAIIAADGTIADGFAILDNAVLAQEPSLALPLVVAFDNERVSVVRIVESRGPNETSEWLALQLPEGSIPAARVLPRSSPQPGSGKSPMSARPRRRKPPIWCQYFGLGC